MPRPKTSSRQPPLPQHDYVTDHRLTLAAKEHAARRRVRDANDIRPSGVIACERIREFCWDLGAELEWDRWMAEISRRLGISYTTTRLIIKGEITSLSTHTVDKIAQSSGIPYAVFYDDQ